MCRIGCLLLLATIAGCAMSFIEDPSKVVVKRNLVYAEIEDEPLELDIYLPRNTDPQNRPPLVVWMHGGSWLIGTHHDCRVDWLAEEGYAVASLAYRTSLQAKWPAQIHDAKAAVRWLRAHADEYGYNADKIAAVGMSSGGHLALMLGLTDQHEQLEGKVGGAFDERSTVDAVISYYGPTDLNALSAKYKFTNWAAAPVPLLLGASAEEDPVRARWASPYHSIGVTGPPVLLIHGENDSVVPPKQSERFHERYLEAGLHSEMIVVSNARHYGGQRYFGRDAPRQEVLDFLRRTLRE
ncbi:MAG: alpha/beta hydrolase fold domain-containing protein [Planctomycetota bacterium]|jgi:acetyl esterase/lipase